MGMYLLVVLLTNCLRLSMQGPEIAEEEGVEYLIDNSVDPCDDFFQYACNSKNRGKKFPYAREDIIQNLTSELVAEASGDYKPLRDFYNSCVSLPRNFSTEDVVRYCVSVGGSCPEEELKKFGLVYERFREKILNVTNGLKPPVITKDWETLYKNDTWSWQTWSEFVFNENYQLGAFQYIDEQNLDKETFFSNVFFSPMIGNYAKSPEQKEKTNFTSQLYIIPMTFPEFLVDDPTPRMLEKYKRLMVITVKFLEAWKNDLIIEKDMTQVLENEWKLARISKYEYFYDERYTDSITLDNLNKDTQDIDSSFNWIDYVNNVMGNPDVTVDGSQIVLIPGNDPMPGRVLLKEMFREIYKMSKREQENLLFWRIFAKFAANFFKTGVEDDDEIYKSIFDTDGKMTSRSENCVNQIKTFFPNILDDLIVNKYLPKEEKKLIHKKFKQVKKEFEDIITSKEWLSRGTKTIAKQKLSRMKISVGKKNKFIFRQEKKTGVLLKPDYVENLIILGKSFWKNRVKNFRSKQDDITGEWMEQARYSPKLNQVQILVGIIKGNSPGLSKNLPIPLIYGGFTSIVGHEMIHGFDYKNIKQENLWDQESKDEFMEKVECMVDQYNNFKFKFDGKSYNVDGRETLDENICDNGGVNTAYRAFVKLHRRKKYPPRFNLTPQQLFWVGWAQFLCLLEGNYENMTLEQILKFMKGDLNAPAPWRVNTVLSNQKKFAEDFDCPLGSKLNPSKRCIVW